MDPDRSNSEGVKLLRSYLHYAASEGKVLGDTEHSDRPLNPIEADVYKALCDRGIPLSPQWGASQYSIDMVAQHPEKVGQFVLAIECDGVTYRDLPTVRDRDRLRQQQLEALGWKYHRIWSTDWFSQRDTEIEKAIDAYQSAAKYAEPMNTQVGQSAPQELVKPFAPPQPTQPPTEAQVQRQPRPDVPQRDRINQYSIDELVKLIQWILSDGCLRTDDEIIRNMLPELGFSKRGVRIEARILQAIQQVRRLG
jgi:very-short-patch-repair endonuclease